MHATVPTMLMDASLSGGTVPDMLATELMLGDP